MQAAQSGIFALGAGSHSYLEFDRSPSADQVELVRAIANLREPRTTTGGVNLVVGFRPSLWRSVAPREIPEAITDFEHDVRGIEGFTMPATQHDLWVWAASHAYDKVYEVAREAMQALDGLATLTLNVVGWTYREDRDLTGFIDGTKNPSLLQAPEVVVIPDGTPGAGGSVVLVQKWLHDTAAWEALSVEEQEKVFGRTKEKSIELPEKVTGPTAHVPRTTIEEGGVERHIFRRNSPYGNAAEQGTMFIGFSCDQHRLARMLARMAGAEDGIRDALTRYTTPVSGAYYFIPSVEALRQFAAPDDE